MSDPGGSDPGGSVPAGSVPGGGAPNGPDRGGSDRSGTEPAGRGPAIRWDRSAAQGYASAVAVANLEANHVVLSFGARRGEDYPGREQSVVLLRRIVMRPMTAKNLHDMLSRLIAEAAAAKAEPGPTAQVQVEPASVSPASLSPASVSPASVSPAPLAPTQTARG
jgi:hypothetical protein